MNNHLTKWLLNSDEPWTRYQALRDLFGYSPNDPEVKAARANMLTHPQVRELIDEVGTWPGYALKRHNDARHPIYKFSTLADFGVQANDPGVRSGIDAVMAHISAEGAFQSLVNIPARFGGTNKDMWVWIICDTPTLLYALLAMGLGHNARVQSALGHLAELVGDNGWRCVSTPELGKFRGPGRKDDPCPIANVYALKALSMAEEYLDSRATRAGAETLLRHWENQDQRKIYLFGIGTDFRKLKYPFVWYDILHVMDVLSRFTFVHDDPRFKQMLETITGQADAQGRFTAASMYRAWKGWSFAEKKKPSPWLTFLVLRIIKRVEMTNATS